MLNQHRIALSVVILCFFSITLFAQQFRVQLSPAVKEHILDGSFTDVTKTESMPTAVKQAFARITSEPSFALADPGQNYQVTDVNPDRTLPRRRLLFAGAAGNEWFVHYEKGGTEAPRPSGNRIAMVTSVYPSPFHRCWFVDSSYLHC